MKHSSILVISIWLVNGAMAQWVPQNSGTTKNLLSVYFTDAIIGYAVGDSGTIINTTNGGANWTIQNSGITSRLNSVFFTDSITGYAVGDSGKILKTTNGGNLWSNQASGILNNLNSVYFTNIDTGFIVCGEIDTSCYILKTTNGGALWTIIYSYEHSSAMQAYLYSVHFPEPNTGYAVGYNWYGMSGTGFLLKTINGGVDWSMQVVGHLLVDVFFINPDTGYVVGSVSPVDDNTLPDGIGKAILKTTDGGTSWINYNFPPWNSGGLASVFFTDANTGYTVGSVSNNGLILKTTNEGTGWTIQPSGTTNSLNSVYFPDEATGYIVGEYGVILKTTNGGGYIGVNKKPSPSNSLKIYPNPPSDIITIETSVKGYLSIVNPNGQEILQQTLKKPSTQVDISTLPNGVYFVKIRGEQTVQVGKVVKE